VSDWCFTSLSTIFQLYHDGGCLLHETRHALGFLSAANTDAPCRRHKTRIHHPVTLSWHRANQSWCYPLNAERLARKQPVPIFTPLVWCGRGSNPRPPDYEANALFTRPPRRSLYWKVYGWTTCFQSVMRLFSYTSQLYKETWKINRSVNI